jgi:hypothetical protein
MTDVYPPFRLDSGGADPATTVIGPADRRSRTDVVPPAGPAAPRRGLVLGASVVGYGT